MRIVIDTETRDGMSVVNTAPAINTSAAASIDGGSGPGSPDGATAGAVSSNSILTIDAGQPSADLVAAIAAAGGGTSTSQAIDAGPAPAA